MSRVPRLLAGQNLAPLSLTPAERFLVSRIDAMLSEMELSLVSGLSPQQVAATLDRLARAGAVDFVAGPPEPEPVYQAPPRPASHAPPGALYDPSELEEQVDLDVEKKRRILDLFYRLEDLTYYALLGVGEEADKKQVKSAYYAVAPEFHPDKYFRKNLGSFKPKIEALFARMTLAHDVLANQQRKREYDEYLATTVQNRAMSAALEQSERDIVAIEAALRQATAQAAAAAAIPQSAPPASSGVRAPPPSTAPTTVSPDEALRLRREALARKLTGGGARRTAPNPAALRATPPTRPPEMDPEIAARAAEALRLRHEAAVADAKRQQVQRYLDAGRAAMEKGDFPAGANAYRIASSLEPDDPQVQATCNEAMKVAAAALADGYRKQAAYEESQERWAEAALSYSKVCAGRPDDAAAHERVAFATLKSSTNVRRAVEFARKAVELAPRMPELRITLARAYAAAGLGKSQQGELDRAMELAQGNPRIQAMVTQARSLAPKDGKVS